MTHRHRGWRVALPGESEPVVVADSHGGVLYMTLTRDGGLEAAHLGPGGDTEWRVAAAKRASPAALCVTKDGDAVVTGVEESPAGVLLTALSRRDGTQRWVVRGAGRYLTVDGLVANSSNIVLLLRVPESIVLGAERFVNAAATTSVVPAEGKLVVAGFGLDGTLSFAWAADTPEKATAAGADDGFVLGLLAKRPVTLADGARLSPGSYLVAYDFAGRRQWQRVPPPGADLSRLLHSDARTTKAAHCSSDGDLDVNRAGQSLFFFGASTPGGRSHYALHDADGRKIWEHDCMEGTLHCSVTLGDDGSVFEAGLTDAAGPTPRGAYVARVRGS